MAILPVSQLEQGGALAPLKFQFHIQSDCLTNCINYPIRKNKSRTYSKEDWFDILVMNRLIVFYQPFSNFFIYFQESSERNFNCSGRENKKGEAYLQIHARQTKWFSQVGTHFCIQFVLYVSVPNQINTVTPCLIFSLAINKIERLKKPQSLFVCHKR